MLLFKPQLRSCQFFFLSYIFYWPFPNLPFSQINALFYKKIISLFIYYVYATGNILILWAVLGREAMRTARNVFIGTLAASDLFLCIFTMPTTLWEVRKTFFLEKLRTVYKLLHTLKGDLVCLYFMPGCCVF